MLAAVVAGDGRAWVLDRSTGIATRIQATCSSRFLPAHVPNVMKHGGVWYRPPLVNIWSRSGGNHAVLEGAHVTTENGR